MKKYLFIAVYILSWETFCVAQQKFTISVKRYALETARNPNRIAYFGDSFTSSAFGYPIKINASNGIHYTNYGVGGTKVCTGTYAPSGGNDLIDKYQTEIALGYTGQLVSFQYGRNDMAGGVVNSSWKAAYKSIIQAFITAGFPKRRLLIIAQPTYSTDAAGWALTRTYALQIANELGILFYDAFQAFVNTGNNDSLFGGDFVHPNDAGQTLIASGYLNYLYR